MLSCRSYMHADGPLQIFFGASGLLRCSNKETLMIFCTLRIAADHASNPVFRLFEDPACIVEASNSRKNICQRARLRACYTNLSKSSPTSLLYKSLLLWMLFRSHTWRFVSSAVSMSASTDSSRHVPVCRPYWCLSLYSNPALNIYFLLGGNFLLNFCWGGLHFAVFKGPSSMCLWFAWIQIQHKRGFSRFGLDPFWLYTTFEMELFSIEGSGW